MRWGLVASGVIAVAGCTRPADRPQPAPALPTATPTPTPPPSPTPPAPAPEDAAALGLPESARPPDDTIEELEVTGDLPVYVVRGSRAAATPAISRPPVVFLTGSCTTPLTYVRAFRRAAAAHGGVVALQGDKLCRDGTRRWSPDTLGTSARIDAALHAAGFEDTSDVTLVGYSQGAERAEWLAHRFPAKYTRFVLMAGPVVPSPSRFEAARAVVTLAGYGDVRENMASGARRLRRDAIPAIYMELPHGTQHGELSAAADETLASAFDWLDTHARDAGDVTPGRVPRPRRAAPLRAPHARRASLPRSP